MFYLYIITSGSLDLNFLPWKINEFVFFVFIYSFKIYSLLSFKMHLKLVKMIQGAQKTNTSEVRKTRKMKVGSHARTRCVADKRCGESGSFAMKMPEFSGSATQRPMGHGDLSPGFPRLSRESKFFVAEKHSHSWGQDQRILFLGCLMQWTLWFNEQCPGYKALGRVPEGYLST